MSSQQRMCCFETLFSIYEMHEKECKVLCGHSSFPDSLVVISVSLADICIIFASRAFLLLLFPQPLNLYAVESTG